MFHRYARGVGGYVVARTGDPDLAETITAEVFCNVVRKFEQCRGSHAAWLWTIVRNELARHFRSKQARRDRARLDDTTSAGLVDGGQSPEGVLGQRESHARLHEALKQLDAEQHTIVFMKYFQDQPNTAIAEALGITANHVGVKIHRTIKRLRELMGDEREEGGRRQEQEADRRESGDAEPPATSYRLGTAT